jgi:hypothetical protein
LASARDFVELHLGLEAVGLAAITMPKCNRSMMIEKNVVSCPPWVRRGENIETAPCRREGACCNLDNGAVVV